MSLQNYIALNYNKTVGEYIQLISENEYDCITISVIYSLNTSAFTEWQWYVHWRKLKVATAVFSFVLLRNMVLLTCHVC